MGDLSVKVFPAIIQNGKEKLSGEDLLQEAVDAAKALGANGIADLRITEIPAAYVYGGEDAHWLISGICIYIPEKQ